MLILCSFNWLITMMDLIYLSLVLVQPRKARPCLTERLLMGHKESNQTKSNNDGSSIGLFVLDSILFLC